MAKKKTISYVVERYDEATETWYPCDGALTEKDAKARAVEHAQKIGGVYRVKPYTG